MLYRGIRSGMRGKTREEKEGGKSIEGRKIKEEKMSRIAFENGY